MRQLLRLVQPLFAAQQRPLLARRLALSLAKPISDMGHAVKAIQKGDFNAPLPVVDDSELERDGASYTIDTVRARLAAQPDEQLFLLIGQDQYAGLHTWNGWQQLLTLVTLAVANRPGDLKPRYGVGTGVRYNSPVGPLQVDLAYGLETRRWRIHLSVGATF